jgi:hypothetical protein
MSMKRFYNDPQFQINQGNQIKCPAGSASAVISKFTAFAKTRILSVRGGIMVAGTNTAAGYQLLNGTTVVGTIACGTSTAGAKVAGTITAANAVLEEGDTLDFKTLANSATLAAEFVVEFRTDPDADLE